MIGRAWKAVRSWSKAAVRPTEKPSMRHGFISPSPGHGRGPARPYRAQPLVHREQPPLGDGHDVSATTSAASEPITLQPISLPSNTWLTTFCLLNRHQQGPPCACGGKSPPGMMISSPASSRGKTPFTRFPCGDAGSRARVRPAGPRSTRGTPPLCPSPSVAEMTSPLLSPPTTAPTRRRG